MCHNFSGGLVRLALNRKCTPPESGCSWGQTFISIWTNIFTRHAEQFAFLSLNKKKSRCEHAAIETITTSTDSPLANHLTDLHDVPRTRHLHFTRYHIFTNSKCILLAVGKLLYCACALGWYGLIVGFVVTVLMLCQDSLVTSHSKIRGSEGEEEREQEGER
ncbi:hypothetical protein BDZ45DRAFT_128892 [Acephala macrosclerotiorum]|nr:hypothetical protein BDZ45DRAFT_128892 [Acephala macrosclerotiorum]